MYKRKLVVVVVENWLSKKSIKSTVRQIETFHKSPLGQRKEKLNGLLFFSQGNKRDIPSPDDNPRKLQQTTGNGKEKFHRQRSFVLTVRNEESERKSPRFKRSRTQSCMVPPSASTVSLAARKRASHSTSEPHDNANRQLNPQAKEFVMKRELPGLSEEVAHCFSDQERAILFDALQTTSSNGVTRSKVKGLIDGADVILKAVLRGSLNNMTSSQVVAKMIEVSMNMSGNHPMYRE